MNILLVTEFFPKDSALRFTGGVEARTYYLAQELKKKHNLQIISRDTKAIASVSLLSVFSRALFIFKAIFQGLKTNPDVVEGSNFVSFIPAFIIARLKRVPAVAWYPDVFKGTWVNKFGLPGLFGEIIETLSLKLNWDHIIALSKQTKKKLVKQGVDPNKITVVYAGINQKEIKQIKTTKFKNPTICCISRLVPYKRVSDLIKAFAVLDKKISNLRLIIIGSGIEKTKLVKLAKKLKVNSNITWYQSLSRKRMLTLLKRSHIFCHPSLVEGFGLVTLEALTANTPYINTNIPINREITHQGLGGLLFKPKSPLDLSDKIFKIFTNKRLFKQKLSQAKSLLNKYSLSQSANQTQKIYKSCVKIGAYADR